MDWLPWIITIGVLTSPRSRNCDYTNVDRQEYFTINSENLNSTPKKYTSQSHAHFQRGHWVVLGNLYDFRRAQGMSANICNYTPNIDDVTTRKSKYLLSNQK